MKNQISESWYQEELEETFQFVVKSGFITKPLLSDLFGIQTQRSLDRLAVAVTHSTFFDPLKYAGRPGWRLSRSGKYEARKRGLKPSYPPRISSLLHDEMALGITVRLLRGGLITDWMSEAQFIVEPVNRLMVAQENRGQKYPDLVFTTTSGGLRLAVELELSRKSLFRYEKALNGYKGVRGIDAVLFAVNSNAITESIGTAIRRTRFDQHRMPVLFADAATLRECPLHASLVSSLWKGIFATLSTLKGSTNAA